MSYSQAVAGQLGIMQWLETGGRRDLMALFQSAINENRLAIPSTGAHDPTFQDYLNTVLVGVDGGTPVYWSPEMCSLLEGVSAGMPEWTLRRDAIPDERGFVWFSKPLTLPFWPSAGRRDLRAIGFTSLGRYLIVTFWFVDDAHHPWPGAALAWDYGTVWQSMLKEPERLEMSVENEQRHDMLGRYLAATFALMEQRIIVAHQQRPDRATRKRAAEVWAHEPMIRVVQLRRAVTHPHAPEGGDPVTWSCSWVVRGHWRQQACGPSYSERRPVFVLPHVKGDPDKPLKPPRAKVFAVIR